MKKFFASIYVCVGFFSLNLNAQQQNFFDGYKENMFVVSEDCSHFFGNKVEEKVARDYIAKIPDGAITHIFFVPTAMRLSYKSKVWESVWDEIDFSIKPLIKAKGRPHYGGWQILAKMWHEKGMNPFKIWLQECRKKGISPWFSLRLNDVHDVSDWNATLTSNFWRRNPQTWRCPYGKGFRTWFDLAFDYSHKIVRDRAVALVEETLQMYDVDGIELDWQRFGLHLRDGRELTDSYALTEVVERSKALVDKYSKIKRKKIALGVRVPQTPKHSMLIGANVVEWGKRGLIDVIAPTPMFGSTDFYISANEWKQALGEEASKRIVILPNNEMFVAPYFESPKAVPLCEQMFDAWACCMYYNGAKSLCAFNMFVDNEIWKNLNPRGISPEICRNAPRRHPLSYRVFLKPHDEYQLQKNPEKNVEVKINCGLLPTQKRDVSVVVIYDTKEVPSAEVSLNGDKAKDMNIEFLNTENTYKFFNGKLRSFSKEYPVSYWKEFNGKIKAMYSFEFDSLKEGLNKVCILQNQKNPDLVRWIEIDIK